MGIRRMSQNQTMWWFFLTAFIIIIEINSITEFITHSVVGVSRAIYILSFLSPLLYFCLNFKPMKPIFKIFTGLVAGISILILVLELVWLIAIGKFELIKEVDLEHSKLRIFHTCPGLQCEDGFEIRQDLPLILGFNISKVVFIEPTLPDNYDISVENIGGSSVRVKISDPTDQSKSLENDLSLKPLVYF